MDGRFPFVALVLAGCASAPSAREQRAADTGELARDIAAQHPLECPPGSNIVASMRSGYADRACEIDGVRQGPAVEVFASVGRTQVTISDFVDGERHGRYASRNTDATSVPPLDRVTRAAMRHNEVQSSQTLRQVNGEWIEEQSFAFADDGTLLRFRNVTGTVTVEGELPAGTGAFTISTEDGSVVAEGECRNGLRHGQWIEKGPDGQIARLRSYRDGYAHGRQAGHALEGMAENGRRVADWTYRFDSFCAMPGQQGSQCGHIPCEVRVAGAALTVRYGDGEPEVVEVRWDESSSGEQTLSYYPLPPTAMGDEPETCQGLARWTGRELP